MLKVYIACFILAAYSIFAPWVGANILKRTGESERFWFFVLLFFNFWGFLFVLVRPSFRKGLTDRDNLNLTALAIGYWAVLLPTWAVMGVFN